MRFEDATWTALSLYEAATLAYVTIFQVFIFYVLLKFTMNPRIFKRTKGFFVFEGVRVVKGNLDEIDNNA